MNEVQENVILRLYAEAVEYSPYPDNRDDKIVELWNYFSEDIPDWQDRFRRILEQSRFNYYMTMTYMDMMYRRGLIDKDEYELCHERIGEKYGFRRDGVIWWGGPPTDGKTVDYPPKQPRKNRTYTKRNKEYWSKFDKDGSEDK